MKVYRWQVLHEVFLEVWHDAPGSVWVARYVGIEGDQIGNCWYASTRDECLIFREPCKGRK